MSVVSINVYLKFCSRTTELFGNKQHFLFQSWQEKEAGKVVVYTTTMGIVRETSQRCLKVRQILRTHMVKFEEKNVFMSREVQAEIKERMNSETIELPQVFVEGHHIGVRRNSIYFRNWDS